MGNQNETNNMELREASKDSSVSVDRISDEQRTSAYPEKNVARAYPSTSQSDGGSLRRLFSFAQLLAFSLTFMESWEVMAINLSATFWNGGPRALVWGCIAVVLGSLTQAYSMAELGSILPIAGAQYHWTHILAPDHSRRFITWMQGWVTWFAWVSALAGSTSGLAALMQSQIADNMPSYIPERWHLTLIMWALLISVGLMNMYIFWLIPWLELTAGIMHVILFIIFVVVLVTLAPRHDSHFVWFSETIQSGWDRSSAVAFNLGMLVPAWGFIGFDGVVHMSEEVRRAKHAVPRSMILTIVINGVMAFAIILVLLYTMGNPDGVLDDAYPIFPICLNATGSRPAANAMVAGLVIVTYCVVAASVASVSRITWAWARDGALPKWLAIIDAKHHVPINALWLPIVIVMLLALLNVGSTAATAFSAFTALSSLGLYTSYIIAISCLLHARWTGRLSDKPGAPVQYGGWKMWKGVGAPMNVFALCWTIYLTIWLPFPTTLPVTGTNMNYALPIYTFVVLASLAYWFVWGKKNWPGLNLSAIGMIEAHD
ncbi:Choline transport protein [Exophiala dermatitidis]